MSTVGELSEAEQNRLLRYNLDDEEEGKELMISYQISLPVLKQWKVFVERKRLEIIRHENEQQENKIREKKKGF